MQATAAAQPNIALVKYWGKRDAAANLPAAGSLSLTLDALCTVMHVDFSAGASSDELQVNDRPAPHMLARVSQCLDAVAGQSRPRARIASRSNFPIGAGLASSASAFAALVVAADRALGAGNDRLALARLAGSISGSAARSLYAGIVALTVDESGIDLEMLRPPDEWPLNVVVAVTETGAKPVGSGEAMNRSAATSPFYDAWIAGQDDDLAAARRAVRALDFEALAAVAERNCLKMHSLMWTSRPPVVYWNPATLACLATVRALQDAGHRVFFTMDAGPQVKAVCEAAETDAVAGALAGTDGVVEVLVSGLGQGAREVAT